MNDDYRIEATPGPGAPPISTPPGASAARPDGPSRLITTVLWTLIALGAGLNALTSLAGFNMLISASIGLATVGCIVLLVIHHLKHRG